MPLLVVVLFSTACATSTFRAYQTPHFTVYADLPETEHDELARDIQFAANSVRFFTGIELSEPPSPVEFFLSGDRGEVWRYTASRRDLFAWSESPRGARYLLDGRRGYDQLRHDLDLAILHHALRRAPSVSPRWFEAGFAAFLETVDIRSGKVIVGRISAERFKALRTIRPIDIEIMLQPERMAALAPSRRKAYDAVAWLAVHYLTLESKDRSGRPPGDRFRHYTEAIEHGIDPADALEYAWGITPRQLEHRIEALAANQILLTHFRYDRIMAAPTPVEPLAVPTATQALVVGRLYASVEDFERARAGFETALAVDPESALARAELARIEAHFGRIESALDLAARASVLEPSDPEILAARGIVRLIAGQTRGFEAKRQTLFAEARNDLELARALAPRDPEILFALGRLALVAPAFSPEDATEPLEAARVLLPNDRQIRLALLEAYAETGQLRNAKRTAASLRTDARSQADLVQIENLLARFGPARLPPWKRN